MGADNFLQQVSVRTRVYSGARRFVDELHRRWMARQKPGEVIPLGAPQRFLPPEREMHDNAVFISYAREDLPAVQKMKAGLDVAGITTWFDLDRLEGGDDYDRKIQRNIARCSYFVPVVSATTQRRLEAYFRREWSYAIDRARNIAEGALFILPVCIDDTDVTAAQVPDKFKALNFTRLPGGEVSPSSPAACRISRRSPWVTAHAFRVAGRRRPSASARGPAAGRTRHGLRTTRRRGQRSTNSIHGSALPRLPRKPEPISTAARRK